MLNIINNNLFIGQTFSFLDTSIVIVADIITFAYFNAF